MLHDVLIVVGVFAWLGTAGRRRLPRGAAHDRGPERQRHGGGVRPGPRAAVATDRSDPFPDVANRAVLQTVPRTINTGLGAMAILGALVLLGGDSLADFALALLLGLVVGTLSSVFTATPLLLWFTRRWPEGGRAPRPARPSGGTTGRRPAAEPAAADRDRWASADPYADIPPGR